ncbi:MAG: transcriptional regulator with XRE-family HTH domain [Cocleimonas sp.]|jgi:transcriptional regulator with XRE-family HTH domain
MLIKYGKHDLFCGKIHFLTELHMPMNKTLGQCLEFYRTELGWDQTQASGETGFVISQQQIGKLEKDAIKNPGIFTVNPLLDVYNKTPNDLKKDMSEDVELAIKEQTALFTAGSTIPLINIKDVKDYLSGVAVTAIAHIPFSENPSKKIYAVKLANELMKTNSGMSYPEKSIVIFDATKAYKIHKDMMIEIEGDILFRRVFKDGSTYFVKTINPDIPNANSSKDILFFGRAIECRIIVK